MPRHSYIFLLCLAAWLCPVSPSRAIDPGDRSGAPLFTIARLQYGGGGDWYEFDDACVSPMDIEDLSELAFGGEVVKETYDHKSGKVVTRRTVRANNAYLLVYIFPCKHRIYKRFI